ncbi:acyl carrier protein [Entomomonas asaccharolytica]|uniref:Acyl carrier protein n=1 Tax=Entomomonas asaccharolytica TaxID=2785331 RepID=A0A974RVZ1_9GAMM|nr:phosphopantetheine-binding protein [Entomomonas asaccharolytica]QQP84547.1 acyl carrier protein [Entomomonas asaccharolytica]
MNYQQLAKSILATSLHIPEDSIKMSHTIDDLKDIDSVDFAHIVAEIEKVSKKQIPIEELLTLDSVEKLVNILEKNA